MHQTIDYVLVSIYTLLWLALEAWRLPHVKASMARAPLGGRVREYATTMAIEWTLTFAVLARLALGGRPLSAIGLHWPQGPVAWGVSVAAIALTLWLLAQQARANASERGRAALVRHLAGMAWFLPRERREFAAFGALSVTAGVCEEVLFRGHLLAFFDSLVGPILATVAGVALFGIAHSYQGKAGVVRTGVVGLFLALVYRATGSLLAPIVMHALMDASAGRLVERALQLGVVFEGDPARAAATPAPGAAPAPGAGTAA